MSDVNATRNTWIAFGTLSLAIVGGMYNLTIAPIDNKVDQLSQQYIEFTKEVTDMQKQNAETAVHIKYMSDALKRIEEQTKKEPE